MIHRPGVFRRLALACVFTGSAGMAWAQPATSAGGGLGQIGPRIIDRNRIDQSPPTAAPVPGDIGSGRRAAAPPAPGIEDQRFTLRDITVEGATALPAAALRATWAARQNRSVRVRDVYAISDAIGQLYADAGYAVYSVSVPQQDFATGHIRIHVTEGHVERVSIEGDTKGADLSLLKAQAARIAAERPLRQATLERNILLMNEIAGLQVGSRFEAIPGQPGAVELKLTVQRKTYEYGLDFDNQGNTLISRTQLAVNGAVNSLFREGDRTQMVIGAPATIERYQYYGLSHVEPLGTDGGKLTINLGELVTNGINDTDSGNALLLDVTASYPIIRAVRESLTATLSFDLLNANAALLGQTLTDERTRVLREGLSWAKADTLVAGLPAVSTVGFSLSEGLDALGARRGNIAYGEPGFTKLNLRLTRSQDLPWDFVVRGKVAGQYAFNHLPATEQFAYGGTDFGLAYDAATIIADSALAVGLEVAYKLPQPWFPSFLTGTEVFGFGDYARLWTRGTIFQAPQDRAASAGIGLRTKLLDKVGLQLAVANPILQPLAARPQERFRFVFQLTGKF